MVKLKVGLYKYKRVVGVFLLLFSTYLSFSQELKTNTAEQNDSISLETTEPDSLLLQKSVIPTDSLIIQDSLQVNDSTAQVRDTIPKGDIETTIHYSSTDSMQLDLATQHINMFGSGKIDYGDIELTAHRINVDYEINEISAIGIKDSLGKTIGAPVFKQGSEVYETQNIRYNFDSKKAIISGVVTKQGEGIMHGNLVKREESGIMYINKAKYTTCDLPDPHFDIVAKKLKLIPGNKILVGPFHMEVEGIPLPIGFGFGMFPMPRKQSSGIKMPTYGEERRRGFYLRDGGYYFHFNDYIDMLLAGEIYSKGSYGLNIASQYRKRYSYSGNISFKYNRQKGVEEGDSSIIKDFWLTWSHSPQSKGTGRFSASVRAGTSSYNQNNPSYYDMINNINQEFSSNVSYSKTFTGTPFTMGANMRLQQNTRTGVVNLQLPDLSVSMNRIYPFKGKSATARNMLQKINIGWNMTGTNRISNDRLRIPSAFSNIPITNYASENDSVVAFAPSNWSVLSDRMQSGIKHTLPISTSSKLLKYFTFSPSVNYTEIWYPKELNYVWIDSLNAIRIDTLKKFSRLYTYSTGAGINTRIYGTMFFKGDKIQAIRHVMTPSISFSYAPDFSTDKFGYYQNVQVDSTGRTKRFSRYEGFVYGTPTQGESASVGFSLQNSLEMKVKSAKDTVTGTKKVPIFENLSLSAGYNFLADSFNLSTIRINARTKLFNKKLDVSMGGTLDPYIFVLDSSTLDNRGNRRIYQHRESTFAWDAGRGLGQFTNASLSLSTSLNPESWENKAANVDKEKLSESERSELEYIEDNPDLYVDFNIPWNVRINYNINYTKNGYAESKITQSLRLSGDFSLTPKWKIGYSTGYDFEQKDFTQTNINIDRDLHCWQLSVTWVPFGRFTSYNVTIRAKSSLLQDLKLNRQRSFWDK